MFKTASMLLIAASFLSAVVPAGADTLADIRETGVYKIGYRDDVPPFSSADEPGKPQGFSIDICRSIAGKLKAQLGMEDLAVEYVQVTAANRLEAVARGRVWSGSDAVEHSLVDELGGFSDALDRVKEEAGMGEETE